MTPEDKFFNNYLKSKTVFVNTFKNSSRIKNLIKDYNALVKTKTLQDYYWEEDKEDEVNELIVNRVNLIDDLLSAYESKSYSPVNEFFKESRKQGYFKDFSIEKLDGNLGQAGYSPNQDPNPPYTTPEKLQKPTIEKPTTPKVTAVSVTPRGGQKVLLTPKQTTKDDIDEIKFSDYTPKPKDVLETRRGGLRGGRKLTQAQMEATARGEGAGAMVEEEEKPIARPPEPLAMTEPDPTPVEVAEGKFEPNQNNDPIADLEPPTFSPDEMETPAVDMGIERQAQQDARMARRPVPAPAPAPPPPIDEGVSGVREGQPITERKVKTGLEDIPNKIDAIPKERLSADMKNEAELASDIQYFFRSFPNELKDIKKSYDSFPNKTLPYYKRIHRQIVTRLQAGKGEKKKIGVILEGEDFIKEKLKEVILEMRAEGLTNEDLLVNVEGEDQTLRNDFGNYEVVVGESGLLHSQREPVYRYIPQTKNNVVPAEVVLSDKSKRARTQNLPTRFRSVFTHNAIRNQNNPFTKPTSQIKLKYLY